MTRKKQKRDGNCAECGTHSRCLRPRKLCHRCYSDADVLTRHPLDPIYIKREPNEVELEQIIADQLANLPKWWDKEVADSESRLKYINLDRVPTIIQKMVHVKRRR